MVSRRPFYIVVALLYILGIALVVYRHVAFDVPMWPGEYRNVWSAEAKVEFDANGGPVMASLALPDTQEGFTHVDENAASPGYGLSFITKDGVTRAEWSISSATGHQELYYRTDMLSDPYAKALPVTIPTIDKSLEKEPIASAINQILASAKTRSADAFTLTREILKEFKNQEQNAALLAKYKKPAYLLVEILNQADIPARVVRALNLEDGRRRQRVIDYVQVFNGDKYDLFDPNTGVQGRPENLLLWEYNTTPLLDVAGASNSQVTFSVIKKLVPVNKALQAKFEHTDMLNFSVDMLPVEEQSLFKGILLIPIGVMVVVFLRVICGLKTSGTFMPVLIAVAFLQTQLLTGLVGFLSIVGVGLVIRSWLSKLNLLLVARISAIIITVICIIGGLSVLTYKLGITQGMRITFFPMIILSWTIERMSILWEEEGPKEVVKQGGGSLLVAVIAYLAMSSGMVQHLTFNFLGLQLIIMATVLVMGNYTGYRLSELKRFKPLADELHKK
ncbi:gonadoliberin III-related protein [Tolumonas auensis DSM 9187]|uniref:Gonadoliberin III-related protein n=1 Tax=Tolumonas auensis (strain DSM 9187 / NBRC 110442 / TA 4) TaxID=595494 RepID=C4LBH7_TOLAT|nr:inactive transglutaminase family protein [Tolumonas auensis]ACQ92412.1 gonadoliberin III-related protein [Tolumonas auensis DSM 9187]